MANHEDTKKAHVILEAVRLASSAEVSTLHQLIANEPETLQLELVLRILLTYLPESTEPDAYIELLRQLASETIYPPPQSSRRPFPPGKELSDTKARTQVRQLHLLPLAEEQDLQAGCTDVLSCFLIHRARRIDVETGFIPEIQELLEPFLDRDPYLREWTISNILPLRRLDYEYYPQLDDSYTLDTFEKLEGRPAIDSLLSRSAAVGSTETIRAARDIRGVVGPWIYGESRRKRRKTHHDRRRSSPTPPTPANQGGTVGTEESPSTWSDVNDWIVDLAKRDFLAAVETVDEWNGPDDVDYGGYSDNGARDNDTSQLLRRQYAQAALATLYTNTATSVSTFEKSYNLLRKVAKLCDLETPPPLDGPETSSIPHVSREILDQLSEVHLLHNALLRPDNPLTSPVQPSVSFAAFILKSGFLFSKLGNPKSCRVAAGLASFAGCEEQLHELRKTLQKVPVKTRDEDSWAVARIQILWLRDWQSQVPGIGSNDRENTLGVFGKMKLVDVEVEVFRALLRASCKWT